MPSDTRAGSAEIEQLWFQEAARRAAKMDQGLVEHLEHVAYYESQQPGLGARYLGAF